MSAKFGILDMNIFATDLFFDSKFPCQNKASRLEYGESLMTHAMVFTGVHAEKRSSDEKDQRPSTEEDTQPEGLHIVRYRVENSHGDDKADKGYLVMTDDWFNEYLYEAVVDRKYLTKDVLAVHDQEPISLVAWDPMGALAN
jgi:bleomycin hydrolase